jgi:predicted ArsR family transcriptional regulator
VTGPEQLEPDLGALGALADRSRRAVYRVVCEAGAEAVSRDDVAAALGVGRTLAAFHLDKLVDAGLLEVSFARRTGRAGPGAGRTAKLYRRSATEHTVTVPPRAYHRVAELLAEAVERTAADATLFAVARERGRAQARAQAPARDRPRRARQARQAGIDDLVRALTEDGYEPVAGPDTVMLRNCPFHLLAEQFPPLVCGMNLALVEGLVQGLGVTGWSAATDPVPGHCCVRISKSNQD